MDDATERFFEELQARGHEPRLRKVRGTMRFDLTDGSRWTRWLVAVDRGDLRVSRRNATADCVIRADKAVFDGISAGETNAFAAVLRGAIAIQGDAELLVYFQRLLPARPREAA